MIEKFVFKFIKSIVAKHSVALITVNTLLIALLSLGVTKLELEYSQKSWFRQGDPLVEKFEEFKAEYNTGSNLILLLELPEPLTKNHIQQIKQLNEQLSTSPFFTRIED